jgi:hypothetical protein
MVLQHPCFLIIAITLSSLNCIVFLVCNNFNPINLVCDVFTNTFFSLTFTLHCTDGPSLTSTPSTVAVGSASNNLELEAAAGGRQQLQQHHQSILTQNSQSLNESGTVTVTLTLSNIICN